MKKEQSILIIFLVIIALVLSIIGTIIQNKTEQDTFKNTNSSADKIEELKKSVNATADSNIYNVAIDNDGREILAVKNDALFEVAYAGIENDNIETIEEAKNIFEENLPTKTGIYLKNESNKFLEYINQFCDCEYKVENGYLVIKTENSKNEFDILLEKIINGEKTYFIFCDGEIKNIDNITGKLMNYDFENIDPYQIYEYVEDNNKVIIEVTTNKKGKLKPQKIFETVMLLLKEIF